MERLLSAFVVGHRYFGFGLPEDLSSLTLGCRGRLPSVCLIAHFLLLSRRIDWTRTIVSFRRLDHGNPCMHDEIAPFGRMRKCGRGVQHLSGDHVRIGGQSD
jgi:hypothetical protein